MAIAISYGQIDPSAKINSIPSSTDKQPWVNIDDLKLDNLEVKNIQTCEHNQGILDGTQEHLPNNPQNYHWCYWSLSMSDGNGNFDPFNYPTINIEFRFPLTRAFGTTLLFYPHSDDYANKVRFTWSNSSNAVIHSEIFEFTSIIGVVGKGFVGTKYIKMEFMSTNIRNRFVKLARINYGVGRIFADRNIKSVNITESIDVISEQLTINTANFQIVTDDPEFSLISGNDMLMINQQFNIDRDGKSFGTYFLRFPWKDVYNDGHTFNFQAVDPIGAMDKYKFWGDIYVNIPITTLISQIFAVCFPTQLIDYEIDPYFDGRTVSGLIPISTCRQALQQVCFAIGAIADDSRRDYVWIYPPDKIINTVIPHNNLYMPSETSSTDYWSGVDVTAHEYVPSDEVVEAHNGIRQAGRHTIEFSEPLYNLSFEGCTRIESTATHAIVDVPTTGTVIISGNRYIVNRPIYSVRGDIQANEIESVKRIENCTLTHPSVAQQIAQNTYDYLAQRIQYTGDVRLVDREVGEMVRIPLEDERINRYQLDSTINYLAINLRADRAQLKAVGNVTNTGDI